MLSEPGFSRLSLCSYNVSEISFSGSETHRIETLLDSEHSFNEFLINVISEKDEQIYLTYLNPVSRPLLIPSEPRLRDSGYLLLR